MNQHAGKTMKDILKDINLIQKRNDRFLVSKMRQFRGVPKEQQCLQPLVKRKKGPSTGLDTDSI